jgi:uncharacterized membrane protein YgdD (TMEM256/DUF423 family)
MNAVPNPFLFAAGVFGFLGVALGAFGAHGLKAMLVAHSSLETWRTAVLYQLVHAVALLSIAMWRDAPDKALGRIGACWIIGILGFSGSLYGLALGGPAFLGPLTPIGGAWLLAGWALLIWHAWKRSAA